jgi:hypothetical protein
MSLSDLLSDLGDSGAGDSGSGSSGLSKILGKGASKLASSGGGGSDWGLGMGESKPQMAKYPVHISFYGPSAKSILSSSNAEMYTFDPATNQRTPVFACKFSNHGKPNISLSRIGPDGIPRQPPLATANASTLSGNVTFSVRGGPEIKLKTDWMSSTGAKSMSTPMGEFKWKADEMGMGYDLYDQNKMKLAKFVSMTDSMSGDPRVDVLVPGDEFFIEMIVISAIAIMKSDEKQVKILMKVLGHAG